MGKFNKGEGGYWAGKTWEGVERHPAVKFNCKTCGAEFKRTHYAYKKGLENPKMMPKFCSRVCQLTGNKSRVGLKPANAFKVGETVGDKNVNWKGGTSPIAQKIRKIREYGEWRKAVYEKDDYTCKVCEQRGGVLNADHIRLFHHILADNKIKTVAEARACSELWDVSNGQTLCKSCHNKKTVTELDFVYKSENRMRGLNRAGGTPGRKWKSKVL